MLGQRIRNLRKEKKMTQQELANKLNLAKSTISQYENNVNEPDNDTIRKIADVFDVSVDYLLGRSDYPRKLNGNTGSSDTSSHVIQVAGQEIEISSEELKILMEMRKHPKFAAMFHDLATAPEKKVKTLIKMWEVIKADLNEEDDSEGIIKD